MINPTCPIVHSSSPNLRRNGYGEGSVYSLRRRHRCQQSQCSSIQSHTLAKSRKYDTETVRTFFVIVLDIPFTMDNTSTTYH